MCRVISEVHSKNDAREEIRVGLQRLPTDAPVRGGYAEALASWSSTAGAELQAELGYRPRENLGLYGFARWSPIETIAGAGIRYTW